MLVVENQHDTKDCPYELLFYPLKMLLTGGAVEFSIRAKKDDEKFMDLMSKKGIKVFKYSEKELLPIQKAVSSTWDKLSDTMTKPFIEEFKKELAPK